MNPELKQPAATAPAPADSENSGTVVPIWLILLTALLFFWGTVYFDDHSGWFNTQVYPPYRSINEVTEFQPRREGPDRNLGRIKFELVCAVCHGSDGLGKPGQAPPLAGSDWVNAKGINRIVRIPVLGLNGTIEVSGKPYNFPSGGMTPAAPQSARNSSFTDDQLANVLTYIRSSWGNKASEVTEAEVKAIRDSIGNRATPMTMDEVKSLPEEFKYNEFRRLKQEPGTKSVHAIRSQQSGVRSAAFMPLHRQNIRSAGIETGQLVGSEAEAA